MTLSYGICLIEDFSFVLSIFTSLMLFKLIYNSDNYFEKSEGKLSYRLQEFSSIPSAVITVAYNTYLTINKKHLEVTLSLPPNKLIVFFELRFTNNNISIINDSKSTKMRFRCKMINAFAMRDFTNTVTAISKMSKSCVLQITPDELYFIVLDDACRSPVVWAQLNRDHFFEEYSMVGASEQQNKIYCEFDTLMLTKSLTSLKATARSVKIKLTNKQQPCLTLEIELPSLTTDSWQCVHDVPIKVVQKKDWQAYQVPDIPNFNISIELPSLKHIRNVVEKMKNISPYLTIIANNNGLLILRINTDVASVATHFQDLNVPQPDQSGKDEISVTVDIKRFFTIHTWDAVHPDTVTCSLRNEKVVYLHLNLTDSIKIHYFIPAVAIS